MICRRRILVRGIVQGVGFRPFVWRLAARHALGGWVLNDSLGVTIEAEGEESALEAFAGALSSQAPPLALVTEVLVEERPAEGAGAFEIRPSDKCAPTATLISPDIAVCDDCLAEMRDVGDRRHGYPFINCTNCGPRYTIIEDIPYDRPRTSMKHFRMCADCRAEYDDPSSRRFHAQPNACPVCGPRLSLLEEDGRPADARLDPLAETVGRLGRGLIAAVKGLGGFHLAADALSDAAVARLRQRKNREEKPLAVMVPDLAAAELLAFVAPGEAAELESPRRPIVLLRRRPDAPLSPAVAPGNDSVGLMLPYTPLHHLLFAAGGLTALVMTSANISEEPICIDNREAVRRLAGIADGFLVHDRLIHLRADDSVVRHFRGRAYPLRRSRGWAPAPVVLDRRLRPVMALGGELKNAVCLARGNMAFLSQHVGDMANEETFDFFRLTINHLERILECRGEILAHDLHPDYMSTRYALGQGERPAVGVQHHHAHAVSCMAENRLAGPVLAVTFDGTGYGTDGHVWGGEILVAEYGGFRRAAHLLEVSMPGGDAAVREPWRMAVSYLHRLWGPAFIDRVPGLAGRLPAEGLRIVTAMLEQNINLVPTSSAGRLFDAAASLVGLRDRVTYEGQAAMELEAAAGRDPAAGTYDFGVDKDGDRHIINTLPVVASMVEDMARGAAPGVVSARFHRTLATAVAEVLERIRQAEGLNDIVLSGGVFQNMSLLSLTADLLERKDFAVHWHRAVPANDGGLALGQAVVADEVSRVRRG